VWRPEIPELIDTIHLRLSGVPVGQMVMRLLPGPPAATIRPSPHN
jgi:hypothetical protein